MFPYRPLSPALHSLLYKIIDYAGLFPPASFPLEDAIRNYLRYRTYPESWMLSRFILPARMLGELPRLINDGLEWEGCLTFSILGQGGADRAAFLTGLEADLEAIRAFRAVFGERVRLDVYETRLPGSELTGTSQIEKLLSEVLPGLSEAGVISFFEAPFGVDWEIQAENLMKALAASISDVRTGFKLRTGGVTADAFPSSHQIAFAVCTCRDYQVALKCTAGLHHPIRSFRDEVGTKMHGFLNVFVAGVLAETERLNENEMVAVLEDEDPRCFEFADDMIVWRGIKATQAQVEAVRENRLLSFGCCSFEEPVEDLSGLGFGLRKS